eukprot:TRINITY_DN398_c0_g1_i1.p1 TRINITY_DN398_c0_g1~~TRINITY_DN398_c0_g1_i1.p1  ORF type:complete len:144 (-),score=5.03 TRINITY_DN398_c0_g1_i1:197-628(-)
MSSHHSGRFAPPPPPRTPSAGGGGRSGGPNGSSSGGAPASRSASVTEVDIPAAYNLTDTDDLPTRVLHDFVVTRSAPTGGPSSTLASICELDEHGSSLSATGVLKAPGQAAGYGSSSPLSMSGAWSMAPNRRCGSTPSARGTT